MRVFGNPILLQGIMRADKRRGKGCCWFGMHSRGRISWADWFRP